MRILVDADACPVRREVARTASEWGIRALYYANPSQTPDEGRHTVTAGDGPDSADFRLFLDCGPRDIVVTDDLGLASMVLARGAAALSSRGSRFQGKTIAALLHGRHLGRKARRAGKRTPGPPPLTEEHRRRFSRALAQLVSSMQAARHSDGECPPG